MAENPDNQMTGAEIVLRALKDNGVKHVFGYPGGAVLPIYDEIFQQDDIEHILVRHEQGAGHAAEGYARSTGKAGVMLVTSGPGATNAVTPLQDALMDSIPLVCITGQVPSTLIGSDAFQECDTVGITRPCTKHNWLVKDVNDLARIIHEAFRIAQSGRPGPVLVDVPMDIFSKEIDVELFDRVLKNTRTLAKPSMDNETAEKIVKQLLEAKTPLLYVGGGTMLADATSELRQFAEHLQLPVAHTLMGKGALPDDHPLILGMTGFWGTKFINDKCKGADWILGLGTRFSEADCSSWEEAYTFNFGPT